MRCKTLPILTALLLLLPACEADKIQETDDPVATSSGRADPGLSWSAQAFEVSLGADNDFPVLSNEHGVSVRYTSSDLSVAVIGEDGTISLIAEGKTIISAIAEETDLYAFSAVSYTLTVKKNGTSLLSAGLSWPEGSYTAVLEEGFDSPTLSNPNGLSVTYSSSNPAVATIDASGKVSLKAAGLTTIMATSKENDTYLAGSAFYSLTVSSTADPGAVTTLFASSGDPSSEDDISNTTFTRLVTVAYTANGATVSGYEAVENLMDVSIKNAHVTITYSGQENIVYKLSGASSNGSFKLYSSLKKQAIWLDGLQLTNPDGAAINNQSHKRTFLHIEGSNSLADASSAAYSAPDTEDMKAVLFSEGQLVFSGSGSLEVAANNAKHKAAIICDDYVRFLSSPSISVTTGRGAGHGIKANEYVMVSGGNLTVKAAGELYYDSSDKEYQGTDGIKADHYFAMTGGTVSITHSATGGKGIRAGTYGYYKSNANNLADSYITGGSLTVSTNGGESNDVSAKAIKIGFKEKSGNSYIYGGGLLVKGGTTIVNCAKCEALEVKGKLTVVNGELHVTSSGDDAINSQGEMNITGGYVYACSSQNDAIDSNSDMRISGGFVLAITTKGAPEVALDANTEARYKLYITNGATVVAYGGLENGFSAEQSVYTMSCSAGSWNALYDGSSFIAAFKVPSGISSVAVSAPSLDSGYTGVSVSSSAYKCNGAWAVSGISGGTSVSLSAYTGSQGGGPGGNPPGGGGGSGGGWRP